MVSRLSCKDKGGEDAGQTLGQHAFAASRRAYHDEVVAAGCRHFHGSLYLLLPLDISKIGIEVILLGVEFGACVHKFRFQRVGAVQVAQYLVHVTHAVDVQFVYHSRFAYIGLGYNQTLVSQLTSLDGYGQCSAYGQD